MGIQRLSVCVFALALLAATGCGTASIPGQGFVVVTGLAEGQELLCGTETSTVQIAGTGFLSEHGTDILVRYTAATGTPFAGGTSAFEEVMGTVVSDTLCEVPVPSVVGTLLATITVMLPGGNFGVSPELTMEIGGTVVGPFAFFDGYAGIGNVTLMVDAESGVLANDQVSFCGQEETKPAAGGPSNLTVLTVVGFEATSNLGGTVNVAADGAFTYNPPVGLSGTPQQPVVDSFTYTIEEPGRPQSQGTVQINITEMIWFIDDGVPPGGTGHITDPFDSLPAFMFVQGGGQGRPKAGDWIFVYEGGEPYDGGINLLDGQKLIGQGVDLVVDGQTIVTATLPPALTNTGIAASVDCIVLADGNRIDGVTVWQPTGNGISGFGVSGPTTVDNTTITGTGGNGIYLDTDGTGTFDFGTTVSVTDAGDAGVRIGGLDGGTSDKPNALTFGAQFTYEGTISQTDAGRAIVVTDASAGSSVAFQNGTINYTGDNFSAIDLYEVHGTCTITSPQTIEGMPFIGIFVDSSSGTFTFSDTTIDVFDNSFSSSGVELLNVGAATVTLTNLDITIDGDNVSDAGGVGIRAGNLSIPNKPSSGSGYAVGPTNLTVNGTASITMTDAEDACVIFGDTQSPMVLDMTFQTISVAGSPQTGGLFFNDCLGSFTVTGTTTITNYSSAGILFLGSDCDLSFNTLNISNGTGVAGRGIDLNDNAGSFTVSGGTFDNFTLDGVIVEDSNATLNNIAFSNVGANVIEFTGTCTASGSGNTATGYGNLCDSAGATVTGSISFTSPAASCP